MYWLCLVVSSRYSGVLCAHEISWPKSNSNSNNIEHLGSRLQYMLKSKSNEDKDARSTQLRMDYFNTHKQTAWNEASARLCVCDFVLPNAIRLQCCAFTSHVHDPIAVF